MYLKQDNFFHYQSLLGETHMDLSGQSRRSVGQAGHEGSRIDQRTLTFSYIMFWR